ncbi:hypothetical protein [Ralstonia holmesii]|uniref:hypothetical protein n=1 Tax=Ralstonia holmesii TaxID=3058602 RepID=UPI0028F5691A|nr:hypothetical protein [Ralstonia sp. LMG 32967]CAJ0698658.1 hypothetical protein R11007_02853 [Ralstonia sp. LMG 32967]
MYLSDEQMNIVTGPGVSNWEPIDLPTGKQDIPAWVRGAHVDWMNGASNAPDVTLKVHGKVYTWPDQRWEKHGSMYIARHDDGRACVLYHDGPISKQTLPDERVRAKVLSGEIERLPDVEVMATTKQSGFGGSSYWLQMIDGSDLVLRGPWHGGAPAGYVEVGAIDMADDYYRKSSWHRGRPWHKLGGGPGVYLTEETFLRIIARFCPHVGMARTKHCYGVRLEPYRHEWGGPKSAVYMAELERARLKQPAGEHWRVYWDGHERYCGQMRIPTYGFEPGVMDLPTERDHKLAARKPW